ncbi:MAG: hypothetical protein U0556_09800 [Dehalococcoidia bacterium]
MSEALSWFSEWLLMLSIVAGLPFHLIGVADAFGDWRAGRAQAAAPAIRRIARRNLAIEGLLLWLHVGLMAPAWWFLLLPTAPEQASVARAVLPAIAGTLAVMSWTLTVATALLARERLRIREDAGAGLL